jgi:hypothetical protein
MKRAVALVASLAASPAAADRRTFASTYEYQTLYGGQTAFELALTERQQDLDRDTFELEQSFEVEHGLTDRWDAGLAGVFTQVGSDDPALARSFGFYALRLQTRYRFAERNEWPVDVAVQAQLDKQFARSVYTTEARLIVGRDVDALSVAANAAAAARLGGDVPGAEYVVGWAVGVAYEVHRKLDVGIEAFGAIDFATEERHAAVGPLIALAPSSQLWLTASASYGLADAPELTLRLLLGIEL